MVSLTCSNGTLVERIYRHAVLVCACCPSFQAARLNRVVATATKLRGPWHRRTSIALVLCCAMLCCLVSRFWCCWRPYMTRTALPLYFSCHSSVYVDFPVNRCGRITLCHLLSPAKLGEPKAWHGIMFFLFAVFTSGVCRRYSPGG